MHIFKKSLLIKKKNNTTSQKTSNLVILNPRNRKEIDHGTKRLILCAGLFQKGLSYLLKFQWPCTGLDILLSICGFFWKAILTYIILYLRNCGLSKVTCSLWSHLTFFLRFDLLQKATQIDDFFQAIITKFFENSCLPLGKQYQRMLGLKNFVGAIRGIYFSFCALNRGRAVF